MSTVVAKFKDIDLKSRKLTDRELELLVADLALNLFHGLDKKKPKIENGVVVGYENIYNNTSDIPKEYNDEFIDAYQEAKDIFADQFLLAFDVKNNVKSGVYIVQIGLTLYDANFFGFNEESLGKNVLDYFIDENGVVSNLNIDDDFIN